MEIEKQKSDDIEEYQQLLQNSHLFFNKLNSFQTHFTPPCIGGTTLDLHRLFVEVASRGGLNQVIAERKWEDVVSAFSNGATNFKISFLLRKYYLALLYNFEQTYFLKKKAPPTAITDVTKQITVTGLNKESSSNCNEEPISLNHQQGSIQIKPGLTLVGVIDEKLDNGYVVSVKVGSDTLKGILYHIPEKLQGPQPSRSPNPSVPRRRKRKKSHLSLLEYSTVNAISQVQENSNSNTGQTWNHLLEPEKQVGGSIRTKHSLGELKVSCWKNLSTIKLNNENNGVMTESNHVKVSSAINS